MGDHAGNSTGTESWAFLREHAFTSADVVLTELGVCQLHPQLARVAARLVPGDDQIQGGVATVVAALTNGV